jgi:hypothetical protein
MPARKKDLSQEIYIKTMRARVLETKAATEYPDKRVELLAEVDQLRAEAAELRKEAAKEKRAVTKQLKDAALEYAVAREQFLKLHLGFNAHDPGINLYDGNRAGAGQVREALVAVLDVEPEPEPKREVAPHQAVHEEKIRNEKAGKGYRTDAQVIAGYDPLEDAGTGATKQHLLTTRPS